MIAVSWSRNFTYRPRRITDATTMNAILVETAQKYGLTIEQLKSKRRSRFISWPRQEALYRASRETKLSFPEMARIVGFNDHSSVIYGIRRHEARMKQTGELHGA